MHKCICTNIVNFKMTSQEWMRFIKSQVKKSSYVKYQNVINLYLMPFFSNKSMDEITRKDIVTMINILLINGGKNNSGLSYSTVNCIITVLKSLFLFAEQNGYCNAIPSFHNLIQKKEHKKLRVLSEKEQEKLSQYLFQQNSLKEIGLLLCLYTGIRIGEVCALKWGDISFSDSCMHINKTLQRIQVDDYKGKTKVVISLPKSISSDRVIPIPKDIMKILIAYKHPENCYFLTGTEKYIEPRTLQYFFKSTLKKCNIENANFHSLRHTFATRCIELGFDVKSLSEILGHSSVNITMNRYVHPSLELKRKNMNKLSSLLNLH